MTLLSKIILLFFIYSFIGWILEVFLMLFKTQKFNNCGFLTGPYCPIYGFAAIIIIYTLKKNIYRPMLVFIYSIIICSFIEYIISLILEKTIKIKWWDYSEMPFNINGRVCLPFSVVFGVLALIFIYSINPIINKFISFIPPIIANVLSISIIVTLIIDLLFSLLIAREDNVNVNEYADKITEISKNRVNKIFNLFKKNDR